MAKTKVVIVRGQNPFDIVDKALKLIDTEKLISPNDQVLIKPNYVVAKHPSTGITTDSQIIEGIIKRLKGYKVNDIIVGEGGAGNTDRAFDITGIREVVNRQGVRLVNLNQDSRIKVRVPQPLALQEIGIAETALKCTSIINVPTLKVHHTALVTLSMKNLMGLILPKSIMHSHINEKIVDLASLFKDKVKLNLIDGLIGAELHETSGNPVEMNLVIAGRDMVAVDTVGTTVMGIDPNRVKYLQLAEERGLGTSNIDEIEIVGESIENVKRKFR